MKNYKHRNTRRNIAGSFPSLKKNGVMVDYESAIERDLLYFLEFDTTVLDYREHPYMMTQITDSHTFYIPDFQVIRSDGRTLVECRPASSLAEPGVQRQLALGEKWANANDYLFTVVTDHDLRAGHRLNNLKLLWRYSRLSVPYEHIARCLELLQYEPCGLAFSVIVQDLENIDNSDKHSATIYALLFRHVLQANLDQPLTPTTYIRLSQSHCE